MAKASPLRTAWGWTSDHSARTWAAAASSCCWVSATPACSPAGASAVTTKSPSPEPAADLAEVQPLRAYDAVHLAAALQVVEADLVLVAGDRALLTAAESLG